MTILIAIMLMQTAPAPPAAAPLAAEAPSSPESKKICRREPVAGGSEGKLMCLTADEWKAYYRSRDRDEGGINLPRTSTGQVGGN